MLNDDTIERFVETYEQLEPRVETYDRERGAYPQRVYKHETIDDLQGDEEHFLRQLTYVVLISGLNRETVLKCIRKMEARVDQLWNATYVAEHRNVIEPELLDVFSNERKIEYLLDNFEHVSEHVIDDVFEALKEEGPDALAERFDGIGPKNSQHLAKNLGLKISANDRHTERILEIAGVTEPEALWNEVAERVEDPPSYVEYVFWRTAASLEEDEDYLQSRLA